MKLSKRMAVVGALMMTVAVAAPMESQWKGKKVAFLGDSITDHCTSATNYWGYLELDLGLKPLVYGVNGHQMSQIKGQAEKLKKDHGDDVDAIFIFAGTNDYFADVPLGKWYDYTMEPSNWRRSAIRAASTSRITSMSSRKQGTCGACRSSTCSAIADSIRPRTRS